MKSLRAQLTLRLVLAGVLVLVLAGAFLQWQVRRAETAEFDASLVATFRTIAMLVEQSRGQLSIDLTGADLPQLQEEDGNTLFLLRTIEGKEVARSQSLGEATLPLLAGSMTSPAFFDCTLPGKRIMRCAAVRLTPPYEDEIPRPPQVSALLTVGLDRAPLDRQLATIRTSLLLVGALTLAALAIMVYLGVRAGLAPLDRVGVQVGAVDAGSLSTRFPVTALPGELEPIVVRLNQLLARLESAFARERRFTATAAHELRTPLAELRSLAEVNLTTPASPAETEQSWRDALATTLRMESLASLLLDLTRAENAATVLRPSRVSLTQAIASAWQPWEDRARERQIQPHFDLPPDLETTTDPVLLAVILGNLCANAVEHSRPRSAVTIRGHEEQSGVTLHFENETNELNSNDLPNLFERFWRKDGARSNGQHHGLGLTLAAEFAALLGGRLSVELGRGAVEFALQLPGIKELAPHSR